MNVVLALLLAVSPELEDGRLQMSALRYKAAVTTLSKVAADAQRPAAERVEANELLARAHLALGNTAKAEAAYEALLTLDPMTETPKAAPKVVAAFERAKAKRFPPGTVLLERRARSVDVIEVQVINPWRLALTVEVMTATTGSFEAKALALDEKALGVSTLTPGSRYFVRAVGADGKVLAQAGSALEPFAGPPAPPAPAPVAAQVAPVATTTSTSSSSPPPLPSPERAPVADTTPRPTTTTPRAKSGTVLDDVLGPRVLPVKANLGRVAGWVLLAGGIVLALVGGAGVAWGQLDLDRARQPTLYALDPDDVIQLRQSGEDKTLYGGIGIGVGVVAAIAGGILLAVSPASE